MAGEASWAITLPNQFEPFGNIMQRGISQKGEQNKMLYSEMLRDRQKQESNERYNINLIQEETKAKDLATGNVTFDKWLGGEYDKAMKEIMSMPLSTMPPNELFVKVRDKFSPLTQTAMRLRNTINTIDENTKLVGGEMTDIDTAKLAAMSKEKAINDLMPVDSATGVRNYMPQNFKPDRDYVSETMQSPDSWELIKDGSGLTDFVKNYKTIPLHLEKVFGDKSIKGYTGRRTPFTRLNVRPDANDRIKAIEDPALEVDVQDDFVTENGQKTPIKILSDQAYDLIQANGKAARGLEYMWGKYKKENNLSYSNPVEDEKRKRQFAVDVIKGADVSEISGGNTTHIPRTTINVNSGASKNPGGDWVNRAVTALKSNDQQKIQDEFAQLFQGNANNYISTEVKDGKLNVTIKPPPKYDIMGRAMTEANEPTIFEGGLDLNDKYLPQKLAKLWQTVMGGDVKVERTQYPSNQPTNPKPDKPKSIADIMREKAGKN